MSNFHNVLFPLDIAFGSSVTTERRTEIVTLGSGFEERNSRWAHSRRRFDAGYGVKTYAQLSTLLAFFEERRGRFHAFRYRDRLDHTSPQNQWIGEGDGTTTTFQLIKTYGQNHAPYERAITKPVLGSVTAAINGVITPLTVNYATGEITFATAPENAATITAGYLFDVPVRFDTDLLEVNLSSFASGEIPKIPLVEVKE